MKLEDVMRIHKEGTMKDLSKKEKLEGGIILKRTGEELILKSVPWFKSAQEDMSVGEQLSIPMGSVEYKAKKTESCTHKTKVSESEFIDVLKKTGHTEYLKEAVNKSLVYKDAASGKLTDKEVLDCFEKLVEEKLNIK